MTESSETKNSPPSEAGRPAQPKRLFPSHLTPFEYYMATDDRPRYPMTFIVRFEFLGDVNREVLDKALDAALERHPLLQAVLRVAKQNTECWVRADDRVRIDWGDMDAPIEFADGEFMDLRKEPGLRIWVRHDSERAILTSQFHHAVCDGIGSYQFLGDILAFYAQQTGGTFEGEIPELDPSTLRQRGIASYNPQDFRNERGKLRGELREWLRMVMGRVSPLRVPKRARKEITHTFPGIAHVTFDKSDYRKIRLAAAEMGQTPNDMLLEKLFITMQQWNQEHGASGWAPPFAVMMPMDLRESAQPTFSCCNVVTYAIIRRSQRQIRDLQGLRASLREESARLKRERHTTHFMNLLAGARQRGFALKATAAGERCFVSAVLSNTGDPTKRFFVQFPREQGMLRCGNLLLEWISGAPPMRPKTRATISILTYRRVLKLQVRCDWHHFTRDDAQAFVEMYAENVRSLLDE